MVRTDGVGGGHGVVGELEILRDLPHQIGSRLPVRQLLTQKGVEHSAGGVQGLQVILDGQGLEDVVGVAHRQVGGVGVIRRVTGFLAAVMISGYSATSCLASR